MVITIAPDRPGVPVNGGEGRALYRRGWTDRT